MEDTKIMQSCRPSGASIAEQALVCSLKKAHRVGIQSPKRRRGFTLVELLVVIGIIALLISILLPALSRARDSAARIQCLSNIRQIAMAVVMYTNANKGVFPLLNDGTATPSALLVYEPFDWELTPNVSITAGGKLTSGISTQGLGPYLALSATNVNMLRCPSDPTWSTRLNNGHDYSFSYSFNWAFGPDADPNAPGSRNKITQIQNSASKVLVVDESELTIDDTQCSLSEYPHFYGYNNRLSLRHDPVYRIKPDPTGTAITYMPNSKGRGNVGFCDGHADFVPRSYAQSKYNCCATIGDATGIIPVTAPGAGAPWVGDIPMN